MATASIRLTKFTAGPIAVLRGHDGTVDSAAFSPDGSRIVTVSQDKIARVWDSHLRTMSVKDLLVEACESCSLVQSYCTTIGVVYHFLYLKAERMNSCLAQLSVKPDSACAKSTGG